MNTLSEVYQNEHYNMFLNGNIYNHFMEHLMGRKEMLLFNNTFNTFHVGHMINVHSDTKRGNPLLPLNGLLSLINSKG